MVEGRKLIGGARLGTMMYAELLGAKQMPICDLLKRQHFHFNVALSEVAI